MSSLLALILRVCVCVCVCVCVFFFLSSFLLSFFLSFFLSFLLYFLFFPLTLSFFCSLSLVRLCFSLFLFVYLSLSMVFSLFYSVHRSCSLSVTVSVSLFVVLFPTCVPSCVCQFFSLSSSIVHGLGLSVLLPSRLQVLRSSTLPRPQCANMTAASPQQTTRPQRRVHPRSFQVRISERGQCLAAASPLHRAAQKLKSKTNISEWLASESCDFPALVWMRCVE